MYLPGRSSVRFEPASKMDASNEDFDILVFGYLVICLLIFLVCFIAFSIFFCVICLGFSIEDLKCCCHKAHKAFEYEEYQLKAVETGMILLIHQLAALIFGSFSRIVNKRSLEFLFTNLKVAYLVIIFL
jgi:hypothetical protein